MKLIFTWFYSAFPSVTWRWIDSYFKRFTLIEKAKVNSAITIYISREREEKRIHLMLSSFLTFRFLSFLLSLPLFYFLLFYFFSIFHFPFLFSLFLFPVSSSFLFFGFLFLHTAPDFPLGTNCASISIPNTIVLSQAPPQNIPKIAFIFGWTNIFEDFSTLTHHLDRWRKYMERPGSKSSLRWNLPRISSLKFCIHISLHLCMYSLFLFLRDIYFF